MPKHFLDIDDFKATDLREILQRAKAVKAARQGKSQGVRDEGLPLQGKVLAMVFERPSTRTRVSFEVGMRQLGGDVIMLSGAEMQLGRGETIADSAKVMSRYVDAIMLRASDHAHLEEMAANATVPVINGLTNLTHPCQIMADIMTLEEKIGPLRDQKIAWVGDGNNVAASWIHAVGILGGELTMACPQEYQPRPQLLEWAKKHKANFTLSNNPDEAVKNADCVITDCWVSMHNEDARNRHNTFKPYQVNTALMAKAKSSAIFMHCLPAHREEEVTSNVFDSSQSVVFDEAENRLHVQKSILLHCLGA